MIHSAYQRLDLHPSQLNILWLTQFSHWNKHNSQFLELVHLRSNPSAAAGCVTLSKALTLLSAVFSFAEGKFELSNLEQPTTFHLTLFLLACVVLKLQQIDVLPSSYPATNYNGFQCKMSSSKDVLIIVTCLNKSLVLCENHRGKFHNFHLE